GDGLAEEQVHNPLVELRVLNMRALDLLPEVAIRGAVVQVAFMLNGPPVRFVRLEQDRLALFDFGGRWRHRTGDRFDLRRIDRPLAQEAELLARAARIVIDE